MNEFRKYKFATGSQSYDRELQRQRCKNYNETNNLVRFENKTKRFSFPIKNAKPTTVLAMYL
jgi:hypothetical protein